MVERSADAGGRLLPDGGAVAVTSSDGAAVPAGTSPTSWTVTVPPTATGVATAVTHLSAALETMGPERSHPARRSRPPRIAFGPAEIPAGVRADTPEPGIVFTLPTDIQSVYVTAPLAYYLGATVRCETGATPRLAVPETGVSRSLTDGGPLEDVVARLLRRCFHMDTRCRAIPGETVAPAGSDSELPADPGTLRRMSAAERLTAYLDATELAPQPPGWQLATYVDDEIERARSLPHLLDRLSLIYPARASALEDHERLRRSLDAVYRAGGAVASVDVVAPTLADGDLHGWLAAGTPIEAYKSTHRAYEHASSADGDATVDPDLAVIVNDEEMAAERSVAHIYGASADGTAGRLTVHEELGTDELAAVLSRPHDFVHYVGHCEVDGLVCRDGHLDIASLDQVRTRTFFLNACGSFHQGRALVDRGGTAGAVTLSPVLDEQATTVGKTFARLLMRGFTVGRSLDLARRRILMGTDYAVVGDGTATAVDRETPPAILELTDRGGNRFAVRHTVSAPGRPGLGVPHPFTAGDRLAGVPVERDLDRATLRSFLAGRSDPVIHDGRFRWADDLAARL